MGFEPEVIARRFAVREGCRFIGYKAVGIGVFSMSLRVLALEPREVPPIEEFLLRLMREGVEDVGELSQLLGLDSPIVRNRLVELRRNELIDVRTRDSDGDNITCVLTERGVEVTQNMKREVMREITLPPVIFHGILRKPVQLGERARRQYLRPRDANDDGLTLVRPIPQRAPRPEEIDVEQLDRVFKRDSGTRAGARQCDIVAIKSVLKRVTTLYEPAVMLEFETIDSSRERQVAFAVEGQLSEEYELCFARSRGAEVLTDIMTPRDEPLAQRLRKMVSSRVALDRLGRLDDVEELATKVVAAEQQIEDVRAELEEVDRVDTRQVLREKIAELEEDKRQVEAERNARKVKYLWTPEIRKKLWEAIKSAKERLLILSGWISSEVVNDDFLNVLRAALQRGVRVWIGYGFDKGNPRGEESRSRKDWQAAEDAFKAVRKEFPSTFVYRDVARSHEKRLICDNKFTFGGSFNLLSFSGEQRGRGKVRHEGADLIEDPEFCEELYQRYLKLFFG